MKKCVYPIAAVVNSVLVVPGCTTNPYAGEHEASKSAIGAGPGSLVGISIDALSSPRKGRGKGTLIGAVAGTALGGDVSYYIDVQETKLRSKMRDTDVSVTRNRDNIILNIPDNMTFGSGSATLKSTGANTLAGVAVVLKEYPKTMVNTIGHISNTGGYDPDIRPSQQRADSVASALITQGVDVSHIRTQGLGPANPITSNSATKDRA